MTTPEGPEPNMSYKTGMTPTWLCTGCRYTLVSRSEGMRMRYEQRLSRPVIELPPELPQLTWRR